MMRPCAHPGCPALVERGRCPVHRRTVRQHERRYEQGSYGRPWSRIRNAYLDAAYPWFCAVQGSACTAKGRMMERHEIEVDHRIPHRGDTRLRDDPSNLQVLCKGCHSQKTAAETGWASTRGGEHTGGTRKV